MAPPTDRSRATLTSAVSRGSSLAAEIRGNSRFPPDRQPCRSRAQVEILEPRSARGAVAPDFSTKKPVISGLFFDQLSLALPCKPDPFFTVLLELPRIRRVATASTTKETEAPMVAKTVLVVEDDPCVRIVAEE